MPKQTGAGAGGATLGTKRVDDILGRTGGRRKVSCPRKIEALGLGRRALRKQEAAGGGCEATETC